MRRVIPWLIGVVALAGTLYASLPNTLNDRWYQAFVAGESGPALRIVSTAEGQGTLPTTLTDRWFQMFTTDGSGNPAVRVVGAGGGNLEDQVDYCDHFIASGGSMTGFSLGGGGTFAQGADTEYDDHPGVARLSTTSSSGNITRITAWAISTEQTDRVLWVVRPVLSSTSMSVRLGVAGNVTVSGEGMQGLYFSYNSAESPNWRTVSNDSTGTTINTTSIPYTVDKWYLLEMRQPVDSQLEYWINGQLVATHTENLRHSAVVNLPAAVIETATAASKSIDIDLFCLRSKPLGQLWTD